MALDRRPGESNSEYKDRCKRADQRICEPVYLTVDPPPTEEQIRLFQEELTKTLYTLLNSYPGIPMTEEGQKTIEKACADVWEKVKKVKVISISFNVEE